LCKTLAISPPYILSLVYFFSSWPSPEGRPWVKVEKGEMESEVVMNLALNNFYSVDPCSFSCHKFSSLSLENGCEEDVVLACIV
jgi:hypothetical protein